MKQALYLFIMFSLSFSVVAIDINTATETELAHELSGVGKVKAQRIVEYREKIGGFRSIEQLREVDGIGPKILERNRHKIKIEAIYPLKEERQKFSEADQISSDNIPQTSQISAAKLPQVSQFKRLKSPEQFTQISDFQRQEPVLNLSPEVAKLPRQPYNLFWNTLLIVPLFIISLLIFIGAWLKRAPQDEGILRKHLVSTTFICTGCGKRGAFQNISYQGHLSQQNIDNDLPPGWVCIPNWLGNPCDYCFDCSQKVHPDNL
jgi:competence ComEA-like helix-hairpin-helix protein